MKGISHLKIGLVSSNTIILSLILIKGFSYIEYIIPCNIGAIIGSCIPDIDSKVSIASKCFNKIVGILLITILIFELTDIKVIDVLDDLIYSIGNYGINEDGVFLFIIAIILGKLSPHRMFTHKWLGTSFFIISFFMIGYKELSLGFATGYILHIVADSIVNDKKPLRFFEFKLPFTNAKNKLSIK